MTFLQIICIVVAAISGIFAWSIKAQAQSRDDIRRELDKINTSEAPASTMGAMCYDMTLPSKYLEYICPVDGEKTAYAQDSAAYWQVESLSEMRNLLQKLQPLAKDLVFTLDERSLCAACTPGLSDAERTASLLVKYADGREVRTEGIMVNDIRYLIGFFSNELTYKTGNDGQEPLKKVTPRLKELLGEK